MFQRLRNYLNEGAVKLYAKPKNATKLEGI